MRLPKQLFLGLLVAPLVVFAAAEGTSDDSEFRVVNPQIDAWAQGTVTKAGDGELVIVGTNMPYLTARAMMHQEMREKLKGVDEPGQRLKILKQVKDAWRDKLEAAVNAKKNDPAAMTFKKPADSDDLVILDAKSIRELPFFAKVKEIKEKRAAMGLAERDFAELYAAHEERVAARQERRAERQAERREEPVSVKFDQEKRDALKEKISERAQERPEAREARQEGRQEAREERREGRQEAREERREARKERIEAGREKLEKAQLAVTDLKAGDKVFVGFGSANGIAFTIIRNDEQPNK